MSKLTNFRSALTVAALGAVVGIGTSAIPAQAQIVTGNYSCAGKPATIVSAAAVINGTPNPDVIVAVGIGNNTIVGNAGDDVICAGPGNDLVYGGRGNDNILAGTGNDYVFGEDGDDTLQGQDGVDNLHGLAGADRIYGHNGNDALYGGTGRDLLVGHAGADSLHGGEDDDEVDGALGDDASPDSAYGEGGADRVNVLDVLANDVGDGGATLLDVCKGNPGELVNCP